MSTDQKTMPSETVPETKTTVKKVTQTSRQSCPQNKGCYIEPSRVKKEMNQLGINKHIVDAIEELRNADPELNDDEDSKLIPLANLSDSTNALLSEAKELHRIKKEKEKKDAAKTENGTKKAKKAKKTEKKSTRVPKKVTSYSGYIEMISKMKTRFSGQSSLEISAAICAAIHELLANGMSNSLSDGKIIVKTKHLLANASDLELSSFYIKTVNWKHAEKVEALRALEEQREKESKKKNRHNPNSKGAFTGGPVSSRRTPAKKSPKKAKKTETGRFEHYVRAICWNIQNHQINVEKQSKYENIRISGEVKVFVSDLIIAYIHRLLPLIEGQLRMLTAKTISKEVIQTLVEHQLIFDGQDYEKLNDQMQGKIEEYTKWREEKRQAERAAKLLRDQNAAADGESDADADDDDDDDVDSDDE